MKHHLSDDPPRAWVLAKGYFFFHSDPGRGPTTELHETVHAGSTGSDLNGGWMSEGGAEYHTQLE